MSEKETAGELFLEVLKLATKSGNPAEQIELIQKKLDEIVKEKNLVAMQNAELNEKIMRLKEAEHGAVMKMAELSYKQEKLAEALKEFDLEKFEVKKKKEATEQLARETADKIGELDAKLKRLEFEEARVKGIEASAVNLKKKFEEIGKTIKLAIEG